ncbi:hypothetical protein [Domibacillus tundrae]|jgi:hypothetical protein|uniref:hypothetical protein n=1 Tax=Domibacillus tundrae TaxID=1587527 RepID=UPI000A88C83B|nr:hypothetical protein [Domibacillus tundrae]
MGAEKAADARLCFWTKQHRLKDPYSFAAAVKEYIEMSRTIVKELPYIKTRSPSLLF